MTDDGESQGSHRCRTEELALGLLGEAKAGYPGVEGFEIGDCAAVDFVVWQEALGDRVSQAVEDDAGVEVESLGVSQEAGVPDDGHVCPCCDIQQKRWIGETGCLTRR